MMDDKLTIILSKLDAIERLIANGGLSPPMQLDSGGACWRISASDEEAKEFSRKKAIARRRAKR
jgi:hypothetical protein